MRVVARQYAPPRSVGGLLRSLGKAARPKRPRFTPGAFCFARLVSGSRVPAPDRNSLRSRSGLVRRRPSPHRPCRPDDARRAVETLTCPAPAPPRPTHSPCGRSCRRRPGLCRHRPMWRSAASACLEAPETQNHGLTNEPVVLFLRQVGDVRTRPQRRRQAGMRRRVAHDADGKLGVPAHEFFGR